MGWVEPRGRPSPNPTTPTASRARRETWTHYPVSTAGLHVVVNGQPCTDPHDNSATCRTSLTPFAGHPVDVSYDRSSSARSGTCRLHHRTSRSVRGRNWEEA
jgi:hypothetical protein